MAFSINQPVKASASTHTTAIHRVPRRLGKGTLQFGQRFAFAGTGRRHR
jgi:hypothetical protein